MTSTYVVQIRLSWWLLCYLNTLVLLCNHFDVEPNWERVEFWLARGIRAEVVSQSPVRSVK